MNIKKYLLILILLVITPCSFAADMFTLGVNAYNSKQFPQAKSYFASAVSQSPNNINIRYWYCLALVKNNELDTARTNYQYIISQAPNSQEARYSRQGLTILDDYISKNASLSLKYQDDNYIKNMYRGGILYRWKPGSINVYIQPGLNQALAKRAFDEWEYKTSQAVSFVFVDSPTYAKIKVSFVDKLNKNVYDGSFQAGNCSYEFQGKYMGGATLSILTVSPNGQKLSQNTLYMVLLHEIGHSIGLLGHSTNPSDVMCTAAKRIGTGLSKRDINSATTLYRGYQQYDNSTLSNAKINEYKEFAAKVPSNPQSWIDLGNSCFQAKQYTEAISAYQKAVNLRSNDISLFINMSASYFNIGNYTNAAYYSKKALSVDRSNSKAMGNLLTVYYKTSQHDAARAELQKYISTYPNKKYDKYISAFVGYYRL